MTASNKNTPKRILPTSIDIPAMPLAPNKNATKARTKNEIAARIIITPSLFFTIKSLGCNRPAANLSVSIGQVRVGYLMRSHFERQRAKGLALQSEIKSDSLRAGLVTPGKYSEIQNVHNID